MLKRTWMFLLLLALFSSPSSLFAQPLPFTVDVVCPPQGKIGEFVINTYEVQGTGVQIEGCFTKTADCTGCTEYRFLQIVYLVDNNPLRHPNGDVISVPFTDTPKGGYLGQPFDNEPWYNEPGESGPGCPYPYYFFDGPSVKAGESVSLTSLGAGANRVRFETWVVCFRDMTICGLAHIRWGYDRNAADIVTLQPLDGANALGAGEINKALRNGNFADWVFIDAGSGMTITSATYQKIKKDIWRYCVKGAVCCVENNYGVTLENYNGLGVLVGGTQVYSTDGSGNWEAVWMDVAGAKSVAASLDDFPGIKARLDFNEQFGYGEKVPALTDWGLLILFALLISTAIWLLRKRRIRATA